jgi:hypothetical protein
MARPAEALAECGIEQQPKIESFKFRVLDDTFTDPKTRKKQPVQFIYEDFHLELHDGYTYSAKDLPEGVSIDDLVNHLNTRVGYPVYEMKPAKNPDGTEIPGQFMSVPTGFEPRFECVNMRYA